MKMNSQQLVRMIGQEFMSQMKLRGKEDIVRDEITIHALIQTLPIREDGSVVGILTWEQEKIVEVYHRGPLTILVGFYPKKGKGEQK